jgi:hypothetical protein
MSVDRHDYLMIGVDLGRDYDPDLLEDELCGTSNAKFNAVDDPLIVSNLLP